MAKRKIINRIFKKVQENDSKIISKEVMEDGNILFTFSGGFDMVLPAGTTDKQAIKRAKKFC